MPTIKFVRHDETNEILLRLEGTERCYMRDGQGHILYFTTEEEARETANEYAAIKGWSINPEISPRR